MPKVQPIEVGAIIEGAARAVGKASARGGFVDDLIKFGTPTSGGECRPRPQTIRDYLRHGSKSCTHMFASLVHDYLDSAMDAQKISDASAYADAASNCREVLRHHREDRYVRPPHSDPKESDNHSLARFLGIYAIHRRDSGHRNALHPELLILTHDGRGDTGLFATFVSAQVICRGFWCLAQGSINVVLHGEDAARRAQYVTMMLLQNSAFPETNVLNGIFCGTATHGTFPARGQLIAVQIPRDQVSKRALYMGDENDRFLRSRFAAATSSEPTNEAILRLLGTGFEDTRVLDPATANPELTATFVNSRALIPTTILQFLEGLNLDR